MEQSRKKISVRLVIAACIMPFICAVHNEMKLIDQLNNLFNFDHNIFLFDSSINIDRFMKPMEVMIPQSVFVFENRNGNSTGLENFGWITSKNTFLILVTGRTTPVIDLSLLNQLKNMHRLRINMKIGIFFSNQNVDSENLRNLFKWCWKQNIVDIFAVGDMSRDMQLEENPFNIFSFNPFGTFDVVNVSISGSYDNLFLSKSLNFHRYPFLILSSFDDPIESDVWLFIFKATNATFVVRDRRFKGNIDDYQIQAETVRSPITVKAKNFVYPLDLTKLVIIVPKAEPYIGLASYLQAITTFSFLAHFLVTISVTIISLFGFRLIKLKKIRFLESVADVFNLLMNDNGNIRYQRLNKLEAMVMVPLTFVGLIFTNGILSSFVSFVTSPVAPPQIDTAEDLYYSKSVVTISDKELLNHTIEALMNQYRFGDWSNRVYVFGSKASSSSSSILSDPLMANIIVRVQKRLNTKYRAMHISQIRLFSGHLSYKMNENFPFMERLNELIHRINQFGLYDKWQEDFKYEREILLTKAYARLSIHLVSSYFDGFPTFIVYGWIAGTIAFLLEVFHKKFYLELCAGLSRLYQRLKCRR